MEKINQYIDHTMLKAEATAEEINQLCAEAVDNDFASVCVNPSRIPQVKKCLIGSKVKVATVVGFPLGAQSTGTKLFEAQEAINAGADEIDMVMNIGAFKDGNYGYVEQELVDMRRVTKGHILKVIIETSLLSDSEIVTAVQLATEANADFIKTSTGFSTAGATPEAVKIIKETAQGKAKIKASGGIKSREAAEALIASGAERLGTSAGILIMQTVPQKNHQTKIKKAKTTKKIHY